MTPIPTKRAAAVARILLLCSVVVCYGDEKVSQDATPHIYKFACERPGWPPEVSQPYPARGPIHPDLGRHSDYGLQPRAQDNFYVAFAPISRYCQLGDFAPQTGTDDEKMRAGERTCADRSVQYVKQHKACPVGSRPVTQAADKDRRLPSVFRVAGDAIMCYQLCEDIPLKVK